MFVRVGFLVYYYILEKRASNYPPLPNILWTLSHFFDMQILSCLMILLQLCNNRFWICLYGLMILEVLKLTRMSDRPISIVQQEIWGIFVRSNNLKSSQDIIFECWTRGDTYDIKADSGPRPWWLWVAYLWGYPQAWISKEFSGP